MSAVAERGLIAWFTKNTVAANLLMWLIVVSGLLVIPVIKKEIFPDMPVQMVAVNVVYPGAAPEEVEDGICRRIEEAVQGLSGIEKITSSANEGAGAVSIEVLPGVDKDKVLSDVRNRVDAIDTFPEEAEKAIVQDVVLRRQVINVAISGSVDERVLKEIGQKVRDELVSLPQITQAELVNVRAYEVSIEVSEEALRRWGLTFDDVALAVRRSSLDLPGGSIKTTAGEILLRSLGQAYRGRDFEKIVIVTHPDGSRVTLEQVARVVDGFVDNDQSARFDGSPSSLVQVFRVGDQSALEISSVVKEYIEQKKSQLPAGVSIETWRDQTKILRSRMELLLRNAGQGLLLVFIVLALFLRFQLAFWVSLGIPISFLGSIALMPTFDVSVNMISLFAFIVVLGIVVDDAIVVGENVYRHLREGKDGVTAAITGSKQVALPVVFGVMTTIVAFSPMLNVDSNARELWRHIPLVVIPCLFFSLIESKLILPAHLSHQKPRDPDAPVRGLAKLWSPVARVWHAVQIPVANGLEWFVDRAYRPSLELCLRWRYVTVAAGLMTLVVSVSLVATGWIRFNFFPAVEGDNVVAMVEMPQGAPVEVTQRAVARIAAAAREVQREFEDEGRGSVVDHVLASVGQQPYQLEMAANRGQRAEGVSGAHMGEVNLQLVPSEQRSVSSDEILRRWREQIGRLPDARELKFTSTLIPGGEDINVLMSHPEVEILQAASDDLKRHLATYNGVSDISDTLRLGKREVKLELQPTAESLGIKLVDLARQVRQGFYGEEAQRVQRGREEVKVMVRYPSEHRRSLEALENMRIRTPAGDEVPFSSVAKAYYGRGYATIKRTDLARSVNVTAEVDPVEGNTNSIIAELRRDYVPELVRRYPALRVTYEGDAQEQEQTLASLLRGFVVALLVIYGLMAIPFRSYLQPLIVMSAIPFGLVGAIWGHVLMGMELSIVSTLGLVALTGVVVNDSLVLVDYINKRRATGVEHVTAIHQAGIARFRPVLLTSLTTFASLTPMLLERSVQARFLMPMAVSLAFGVLFATIITLVLVPTGYLVLEDVRRAWRWIVGSHDPDEVSSGRSDASAVESVS